MSVAGLEGSGDGLSDLTRLGLPCSQADGWDLCARVERVCQPANPTLSVSFKTFIMEALESSSHLHVRFDMED